MHSNPDVGGSGGSHGGFGCRRRYEARQPPAGSREISRGAEQMGGRATDLPKRVPIFGERAN
jgi:hypothetical protein